MSHGVLLQMQCRQPSGQAMVERRCTKGGYVACSPRSTQQRHTTHMWKRVDISHGCLHGTHNGKLLLASSRRSGRLAGTPFWDMKGPP
jgi:hypothetical protein